MSKKIAIFLDGTWNQVDDYTNVYTLYQYCQGGELDIDGGKALWDEQEIPVKSDQVRYYDSGVGTSVFSSPLLIGGALGLGLKINVAQAYLSLCRCYQPGDEVFIFGFSRGAYTARSLGGLLNRFGVLAPKWIKKTPRVKNPIKKWQAERQALRIPKLAVTKSRQASRQQRTAKRDQIIQRFVEKYCQPEEVRIKFMGIFDTVGALGIPSFLDPLGKKSGRGGKASQHFLARNLMPNASFPGNVDYACHALAIDEYRPHFKPTLWVDTETSNVEQRWFIGAHANVGGGYPNNLLNNKPMHWIYQQALSHGLKMGNFLLPHEEVHLDEPINDSFAAYRLPYKLLNFSEYYRFLDAKDSSQSLDDSVLKRIEADPIYRPPNMMGLDKKTLRRLSYRANHFDRKLKFRLWHEGYKNREVKDESA